MVTTDAYQGPNMANFFFDKLKVRSVYGLDDSGAFGAGVSAAFEAQARKRGMAVLGHNRLDPKAADYSAVITKIKSLTPQGLYYRGDSQAGVKVAKQSAPGFRTIPAPIQQSPYLSLRCGCRRCGVVGNADSVVHQIHNLPDQVKGRL
jgi:branched-chain amino acid transport system substrate-binding protein